VLEVNFADDDEVARRRVVRPTRAVTLSGQMARVGLAKHQAVVAELAVQNLPRSPG